MMRRSSGNLHFFINGVDQGIAADRCGLEIWGVIDLYGMTVKVKLNNKIYNHFNSSNMVYIILKYNTLKTIVLVK